MKDLKMNKDKIIVLDCDGVLLNYNETFGYIWEDFFQEKILVKNSNSFFAENYYGINIPKEKEEDFYEHFNQKAWGLMNELPQAIEATHKLKEAGYKILVVTSINKSAQEPRHNRLLQLGFSVDATIATGLKIGQHNPKKTYIDALQPEYFVDDLIDNFHNLESKSHLILIENNWHDSPNKDHNIKLHSEHPSLWNFVDTHIHLSKNSNKLK